MHTHTNCHHHISSISSSQIFHRRQAKNKKILSKKKKKEHETLRNWDLVPKNDSLMMTHQACFRMENLCKLLITNIFNLPLNLR